MLYVLGDSDHFITINSSCDLYIMSIKSIRIFEHFAVVDANLSFALSQ